MTVAWVGSNSYATVQQAVDAAVSAGGGRVDIAAGVHTENVTVAGAGVTLAGAGRTATEIRAASGDVLTFGDSSTRATGFAMRDLTLRSLSGGGHVMACAQSFSLATFDNCDFRQDNDGAAVFHFDDTAGALAANAGFAGGSLIDLLVVGCNTRHKTTATVASWHLRGGAVNRNRWVSTRSTYSGDYVWLIDSTAASSYASNNTIESVTSEVNVGGVVKILGGRSNMVSQVGVYDLQAVGPAVRDLFVFGNSSVAGLPGSQNLMVDVSRAGGQLAAGVSDVRFAASSSSAGVTLLNCGTATALQVDANNKRALVVEGNVSLSNGQFVSTISNRDVRMGRDGTVRSGAYVSSGRPNAATSGAGAMWYDQTLGKPVWSDGTAWRLADGSPV